MTAFPCILYQRLQVRLDGHFCTMHAVVDMLRSVWLTYPCLCDAGGGLGELARGQWYEDAHTMTLLSHRAVLLYRTMICSTFMSNHDYFLATSHGIV